MKRIITLLSVLMCVTMSAQNVQVTGHVYEMDADGIAKLPLTGASVQVKGTRTGCVTDIDGQFSIQAQSDGTLVFSFFGFKTVEKKIAGRSVVDVVLESDVQVLDEVVAVGYGSMRKSDLATSISSVNTSDMKVFPASSASEMLRGRAAGVTVTSSSGRPGSVPSITIRGSRSISASNTPLYVIDGCIASDTEFAMISSNDIESVEVLKDAASQAIYGARASDGVILVTTKRGKSGDSEVSYNGYVGLQSLHRNFEFYNAREYIELRREAMANDLGVIDAKTIPLVTAISDEVMAGVYKSGEYVDWEDLMFKSVAPYHNHELSVRGGTDRIKAMASVGYFNQDGLIKLSSGYERLNARMNVDFQVKKWLKLGLNTSFGFTKREIENGAYYQFITRSPLADIYDENGALVPYINSNKDTNPIYSALHDFHEERANNTRLNAFAELTPFKGFVYKFNVSYYNRVREDGHSRDSHYPNGGGSTASITNYTTSNVLLENVVNYNVPIRDTDHKLNLTLVQSVDHNLYKTIGYSVNNIPVDKDWDYLANGELTAKERRYTENNLVSFMARAQYSYKDRYLVNVAYRRDGSSRFGMNTKWGNFPSIALAWRLSQEDFMKNVKWVNSLKLRTSFGIVGNQNGIDNYTTLGLVKPMPGEFGDSYYLGYLPSTELPNKNLRWEQSSTFNAGVDFTLFSNKLNGTLEYYNTRTTDLLVSRTLNAALGYTSMLDNLGETRTQGMDFNLTANLISTRDWNWSVSANISHSTNRIVKIDDSVDAEGRPMSQPGNNWIVGAPINIYYDYQAVGVYQYDDFYVYSDGSGRLSYELRPAYDTDGDGVADAPLQREDTVEPGCVKLRDVNGDGKITSDDRVVYKRDPDMTLSLSTNLTWRNFDFYMDWYAVAGGYVLNPLLYNGEYGGDLKGKNNGIKVDYWTPYNATNVAPRPLFSSDIPYLKTMAYQDASYLRLRSVQLGYTFDSHLLQKIRLSKLRVYCTATNLLTFTQVLSYSPEVMGSAYPEARQVVLGVNLTF